MEILRGFDERATSPTVCTIGSFATVHKGHRAVIDRVKEIAQSVGAAAGLVTFEPHPLEILRPAAAPCRLNTLKQRLNLFADAGVERVLIVDFDQSVAAMEADEFVQKALVESMRSTHCVVGTDFRFGRARGGSRLDIAAAGIQTEVIDLLATPALATSETLEKISTTQIRGLLGSGHVRQANDLLHRPHRIFGRVVRGDGAGTGFGFPTANIACEPNSCIPAPGIYAGRFIAEEPRAKELGAKEPRIQEALDGVIYVGDKSTVSDAGRIGLEIHIFDFTGDLYGHVGEIEFLDRIRGDKRFESTDELISQMHRDAEAARGFFSDSRKSAEFGILGK